MYHVTSVPIYFLPNFSTIQLNAIIIVSYFFSFVFFIFCILKNCEKLLIFVFLMGKIKMPITSELRHFCTYLFHLKHFHNVVQCSCCLYPFFQLRICCPCIFKKYKRKYIDYWVSLQEKTYASFLSIASLLYLSVPCQTFSK